MSTTRVLAITVLAATLGFASGCTGSRGGGDWSTLGMAPWDRPVKPPSEPDAAADFATGKVTSVSVDGGTLDIEITSGVVSVGDPAAVVMVLPDPSPRNFADEVRERRVGTVRVVEVKGNSCRAEMVPDPRNATVEPGDSVTIRNP